MMCNQIIVGSLTFLLTEFLATEITKEGWYSFLLLCLKVSFNTFYVPNTLPPWPKQLAIIHLELDGNRLENSYSNSKNYCGAIN
jgi:hypothetical protein